MAKHIRAGLVVAAVLGGVMSLPSVSTAQTQQTGPGSYWYRAFPYTGFETPYYTYSRSFMNDPGYAYSTYPSYYFSYRHSPRSSPTSNAPAASRAQLDIRLPVNAELWFNGVPTMQTGTMRKFESPPLTPGVGYAYELLAKWREGDETLEQTHIVHVRAGQKVTVEFTPHQGGALPGPTGLDLH